MNKMTSEFGRMLDAGRHCFDVAANPLAYRYFKRVISHSMNIATSIFMPLDKIDFMDEKPRPSVPEAGPA
jgi:hypothetical protein